MLGARAAVAQGRESISPPNGIRFLGHEVIIVKFMIVKLVTMTVIATLVIIKVLVMVKTFQSIKYCA